MNEKLTAEQIIEIIEESMFDCYPQWRNLTPSDLPIVAEKIASLINTAEDKGNYIVWSDGRKTQIEDEELLQYIAENIQQEDK